MNLLVLDSCVNRWNPAPKAEVHRRAWGVRAVRLELVVEADLQAPVDEGTCSLKIAETHCEDALLMLEQSPCHTVSMRLASMIEVHRPEC